MDPNPLPPTGVVSGEPNPPGTGASAGTPPHVRPFVWGVAALALAGLATTALAAPSPWPSWPRFLAVVAFGTLALVDRTYIHLGRQRVRISFSFSELGVLASLVLLPGVAAALAVMASTALYEAAIRRTPIKALFNVAQHTLGAAVAGLVLAALPPLGIPLNGVSLVSGSIAALTYVLVTASLWLLLLRRLVGAKRLREELAPTVGVDAVASLGTVSVGVIALYLWDQAWVLLFYAVVPLIAILVAYRYLRLSRRLTDQRATDADSLRRLVSSTTDGIVMTTHDDRIEVWNPVMEALTGVPAEEAEGGRLTDVMERVPRRGEAAFGAEPQTLAEWGAGRVLEEHTALVRDVEDEGAGLVIVLRDVTRQQEFDALKDDFVARVSHELRTPLTPITGFVELLRDHPDRFTPSARHAALESIGRSVDRMTVLVDHLLKVVELDNVGLTRRAVAVELPGVAKAAWDLVPAETSGHRLDLAVPAGTVVAGDEKRLTEALRLLLDNAVRYSPPSTVTLTGTPEGDHVAIRVRDEGPGIPDAARNLVFEPFSRLERPLRMSTGGLGLGLFIARRLTESMGGHLTIAATGDEGTTMEVRLPIAGPDAA